MKSADGFGIRAEEKPGPLRISIRRVLKQLNNPEFVAMMLERKLLEEDDIYSWALLDSSCCSEIQPRPKIVTAVVNCSKKGVRGSERSARSGQIEDMRENPSRWSRV